MTAATLTPGMAAADLMDELRGLLQRHDDGVSTVDELKEFADELTSLVSRTRGRIRRLARKAAPAKSSATPEKPAEAEPEPVQPKAEAKPEPAKTVAPSAPQKLPAEKQPEKAPAAPVKPVTAPTVPRPPEAAPRRPRVLLAVLAALVAVYTVVRTTGGAVRTRTARWTARAASGCRSAAARIRTAWTSRKEARQ